jgi:polysaccharide biosynthesis protein PelA
MLRKILCVITLLWSLPALAFDENTRVALYYGDNPPLDALRAFNVVVVNAQPNLSPKRYNNASTQLYAYVTVGELDADAPYKDKVDPSWRKGENASWRSGVMDMSSKGWRDFLLQKVISPLWEQGYRGFFLDTMDSYTLLKGDPEQKKQQQAGLIDLVKKIKETYPDASIISNRGFELLPDIHNHIDALAAESLFSGWDPKQKKYLPVAEKERNSLLQELNTAKQKYHLPIIVIDYVAEGNQAYAKTVAKKILDLGFMPWVTTSNLDSIGVGSVEIIPRKILFLHGQPPTEHNVLTIPVFKAAAFVTQFMGFVPVLQSVDSTLEEVKDLDPYAGVIMWFIHPVLKDHLILEKWLEKPFAQKIPMVFMEHFGISKKSAVFQRLGLDAPPIAGKVTQVQITAKENSVGYEILPKPTPLIFTPMKAKSGKILLTLTASNKQQEDAVAITPWGGYALQGYNLLDLPNEQQRWAINPFEFFKQALRLPNIPVPDITTENGRRILTAHIDGDAFISLVPWKSDAYTSTVILDEILKAYRIPTSVSVIMREFELVRTNPTLEKRLIQTAKQIFALPWVEAATHTYSHPLNWGVLVEGQPNKGFLSYPNPNYSFSYEQEVKNSADFMNKNLLPKDKKVAAVFWSGDTQLAEKPLQMAHEANLKNINGMSTLYTHRNNSLTNLGAFGVHVGPYFHIFSPISNEFEYTLDWTKPYYLFQQAIHTFKMTESPIRYKPMSIYYHFYSAAEQSSLRALKRVYNWAIKQEVTPLFITDYIERVLDFNRVVLAKDLRNPDKWLITNNGTLREFRLPNAQEFPDFKKSSNIIGFNKANQDLYIHLGNKPDTWLTLSQEPASEPYLINANAMITQWRNHADLLTFTLKGYVPLQFQLANMAGCTIEKYPAMPFLASFFDKTLLQDLLSHQKLTPEKDGKYFIEGVHSGTFAIRCT